MRHTESRKLSGGRIYLVYCPIFLDVFTIVFHFNEPDQVYVVETDHNVELFGERGFVLFEVVGLLKDLDGILLSGVHINCQLDSKCQKRLKLIQRNILPMKCRGTKQRTACSKIYFSAELKTNWKREERAAPACSKFARRAYLAVYPFPRVLISW